MKMKGMMVAAVLGMMMFVTTDMMAHRGGGERGPNIMRHLRGLDLTDAQKDQIKALAEEFKADHADEIEQMKSLHEQAREQHRSGDKEAAKATMEQARALRESMKADHEELREAIMAVLTDDQRAQLEERKERCGEKREKKEKKEKRERGNRGGGGDIR